MSEKNPKKLHLLYITLGVFIIILYFLRLFYPQAALYSTPDFGQSDLWNFSLPMKKIYWEALQKNVLPIFDTHIGNGFPVLAENQIGAFNLQNLVLYKLFPFVTAFNLSYIFIFITAFIGCYLLFTEFRVLPFLSFTGGLIFTFSGFFVTQIVHPNLIHTASYFPLLFFLLEKWTKSNGRPRGAAPTKIAWILLFIFFQTQCFLAGFPQFFLIINFFFFLYLFFLKNTRNTLIYLISLISLIILCLPQILPSLEFTRAAGVSSGLPLEKIASFPFNPKHLFSFFNPFVFGNPKFATYPTYNDDWGIFWESTFYVGVITFIFYLLTIVFHSVGTNLRVCPHILHCHKTKSIFKIGLISLFLGLGKYTPLFLILQIPPFNFFRVPARFMFLFMFSVVFVAIMFLNKIYKNLIVGAVFSVAVFLLIVPELLFQFWSYHLVLPARAVLSPPEITKYLKKEDLILSLSSDNNWNEVFLKRGWHGEKEAEKYLFLRNALRENINVLWGINNINVYASRFPAAQLFVNKQVLEYFFSTKLKKGQVEFKSKDIQIFEKYGVNFVISPWHIKAPNFKEIHVFNKKPFPIYFYRVDVKPFKYFFPKKIKYVTVITVNDLLKNGKDMAILEGKKERTANNQSCQKIKVAIENGKISVNHACPKNTFLLLNYSYYPNISITVNGSIKKPVSANVSQIGVWL